MAVFDCSNISLRNGSSGEKVKTLQTQLKNLGYYSKTIDGSFGYYTGLAVQSFQRAYSLTVDGIFGPQSCKKLNQVIESKNNNNATSTSSTAKTTTTTGGTTTSQASTLLQFDCPKTSLQQGNSGSEVTKLQTMLKALGYYTRQVDGSFGTYTARAVKDFQSKTKHSADGWFGPKTCPDLNQAYKNKVGVTSTTPTTTTTSSGTNTKNSTSGYVTPDYLKKVTMKLTVLPSVVVLPETSLDAQTGQKTVGNDGSINTDTNFDCSKINLNKGSQGDDVKKLQTILKARGYYTRQVDGDYGTYTVKAVKALQSSQGNDPDGWFGPKTCAKLQGTSTTSSTNTNTKDKKSSNYIITDFTSYNTSDDIEGLSHDVTLQTPFTQEKLDHIRKLQKTQFDMFLEDDLVYSHEGYINDVKVTQSDELMVLELSLTGYTAFLDMQVEYEKTAKRSVLLKELIEKAGLKANIDLTGLKDDEYTVKAQKAAATTTTSTGSGGLVQVSGNDCEGGAMQTNRLSARSFDINVCGGNTKIGNSSANYATDTANMSAKEAILDVYNRFKYGPSLTSSAVYNDNRRCPRTMWQKTGKIFGNCADISRLIKCVGEVHGLKVGIRHCPSHYYNLIEVNGKTYRFDCCFKSGVTGKNYGSETCNTLTKNGGPWQ